MSLDPGARKDRRLYSAILAGVKWNGPEKIVIAGRKEGGREEVFPEDIRNKTERDISKGLACPPGNKFQSMMEALTRAGIGITNITSEEKNNKNFEE